MNSNKMLDELEIELSGIPCLYVKPNFIKEDLPTVIFYHGWHSRKENNKFLAEILACNGYGVILPDDLDHGERGTLDFEDDDALEKNFWRIVFNGVDEFKMMIKDAAEKLGINPERIAVSGSSMGGFIASGVFAANNNIKCLVCFNGGCAWEMAEKMFLEKDGHGWSSNEQSEKVQIYDPLKFTNTLYPRPMLLLHGDSDTQVYIDIQRYFYNEMLKVYKDCPEKIKLFEVQRLNHDKTVSMVEETVNWLNKYL